MKKKIFSNIVNNTVFLYQQKKRWKFVLFIAGIVIFVISLLFTNKLVEKISTDERQRVKVWADAIQHKARLMNYTNSFFEKVKVEERKKVRLWAETYKKIISASLDEDITFYLRIIAENNTIPVILTDNNNVIINTTNVEFKKDDVHILTGKLLEDFSQFEPIKLYGQKIYYKESKVYTELRSVIDYLVKSFFNEVVINSASLPVVITDSSHYKVIATGNIDSVEFALPEKLKHTISQMQLQNEPIIVDIAGMGKQYIYYTNSFLLTQLKYYPFFQFLLIGLFILIAYFLFNVARNSEQNQVWAGMAKETAHQIGTPLSALMAWVELLKIKGVDSDTTSEMLKDINHLQVISERFSKIGSEPVFEKHNLKNIIIDTVEYLKIRISKKVIIITEFNDNETIIAPLNRYLFEWVLENICKNSVDAMNGSGLITITLTTQPNRKGKIFIDISDTGKGIAKNEFNNIFNPGYTSKIRGWGLGLTLSKRIIENYHKGKIFIKDSQIGKGTTIRIQIPKE